MIASSPDRQATARLVNIALIGPCGWSDESVTDANSSRTQWTGFRTAQTLVASGRAEGGFRDWALIFVDERVLYGVTGVVAIELLRSTFSEAMIFILLEPTTADAANEAVANVPLQFLARPESALGLLKYVEQALPAPRDAATQYRKLPMFSSGIRSASSAREESFEKALTQIAVHFQPIVQWSTRTTYAYEALLRCADPAFRNPVAMFDEAEALSRLFDLSRAVRAVTGAAIVNAPATAKIFVNIHGKDLLDEQLFDPAGPFMSVPERVVIELTERVSLLDLDAPEKHVARLRSLGHKIALDDLGAGYSGLTLLPLFEPDVVKIDMSLIRDIHRSKNKQTVVRSLLKLATDVGAITICEGVENEDECDVLLALGCDYFQGYLFGRPAAEFAEPVFAST